MKSGAGLLQAFGLDVVTESVYLRMLAHPQDGIAELCAALGLDAQAVRSALDQLSALALVRAAEDDDQRLHTVNPQLGMEILLTRQQANLAHEQERVQAGRAAAAEFIAYFAEQSEGDGSAVRHLRGLDTIRDYLTTLNQEVTEEFLVFAPGGRLTEANMRASQPLNQRLLDRGVQMRAIYLDSIRRDPASLAYAEWLNASGGRVRTMPVLPTRMIICDQRVAVIAADSNDTSVGAMAVTSPGMIVAFKALFDTTWNSADELTTPVVPKAGGLTRQQLQALELLAEGRTDESIARLLGISPRTARRITNTLMTELGARSRFQAGVLAVRAGHLSIET